MYLVFFYQVAHITLMLILVARRGLSFIFHSFPSIHWLCCRPRPSLLSQWRRADSKPLQFTITRLRVIINHRYITYLLPVLFYLLSSFTKKKVFFFLLMGVLESVHNEQLKLFQGETGERYIQHRSPDSSERCIIHVWQNQFLYPSPKKARQRKEKGKKSKCEAIFSVQ